MGLSGSDPWYLDARAGIERAGASRAGGISVYNVLALINGVDVTTSVLWSNPGPRISNPINDQPHTCTLTLKFDPAVVPVNGYPLVVAIGEGVRSEFSGRITNVQRRIQRLKSGVETFWDITALDTRRDLGRRLVNAAYENVSASFIARDLMDNWTTGFSTAAIAPNLPTIDSFVVENEYVPDALTRLANLIDGAWFTEVHRSTKMLHFFGTDGDTSYWAGTNPLPITTSAAKVRNALVYALDHSQLRTRVIVEGMSTTCPTGTPSNGTTASNSANVDGLLVGGAGGGGADDGGGGGGAEVLPFTDTLAVGSYAVVIGPGGAAGVSSQTGGDGGDSTFNGRTAIGGGAGLGSTPGGPGTGRGANSGGGAAIASTALTPSVAGGHTGGNGDGSTTAGGGAGAAGDGIPAGTLGAGFAGRGGPGVASSISGALRTYGDGGGGGGPHGGTGGDGTGSNGNGGTDGSGTGSAGTANTGRGGGGGKAGASGNAGGSGVLILSYVTGTLSCTGGTITTVAGRTIHTFTANDTLVVSAGTITTEVATVTDLPIDDPSQLYGAGGTVRIASHVVDYDSTGGASFTGQNPPGTTVGTNTAAGATSLPLTDSSQITSSPGWVKVGDQYVRFTGIGGGSLTGLPASGFGALALAVTAGTQVSWLPQINLSSAVTFDPALAPSSQVIQRVSVDDLTAQATLAAIEGGDSDGIYEHLVSDSNYTVAAATARANAELHDFGSDLPSLTWTTTDLNAKPGRTQTVTVDDINIDLLITNVDVSWETQNTPPVRACEAHLAHVEGLLDVIAHAASA